MSSKKLVITDALEDENHVKMIAEYIYEARDDIVGKNNLSELADRLTKTLEYNLFHGELIALKILLPSYKELSNQTVLKGEQLKSVHILGWCVELLTVTFIVNDDIMDNSITRYNRPCWYRLQNIGMSAVNDCIILENFSYHLLAKHFRHTDIYVELMRMFHEVVLTTSCGQCLDMLGGQKSVTTFTMAAYRNVTDTKTSPCVFFLPFALAMHLAGVSNPLAFQEIKSISLDLGYYHQVQNDFLDSFGHPEDRGKIGTDIQENKFSWLAIQCMMRASQEQKQVMEECYGQNDPAKVQRVKELYKDLKLVEVYETFEKESIQNIESQLQKATQGVPRRAVLEVLNRIRNQDML
uniref:Farnesyl pyrophosphate synthase n=1 Tax=Stomoxys calcitrans TaxID=35570 RepID=A0A1I8PXF3_STOCA